MRVRFVHGNAGHGGSAGAISANNALTFTDCTFTDNAAAEGFGGAIFTIGGMTATNCTFDRNTAADTGAVVVGTTAGSSFNNCTFTGNVGTGVNVAGAITLFSTTTFTHCTILPIPAATTAAASS